MSPPALSRAGDRRIAPGRRHRGPGERPQADPDEEQSAVAAAERAGHQGERQDGQDRRASRCPRAPATGPTAAPAPASPTDPGRDRRSPRRHRSARPARCRSGPSSSFPAPIANSSGAAAMCSHRPTDAPEQAGDVRPGHEPADDGKPELQPADRRVEELGRRRPEEARVDDAGSRPGRRSPRRGRSRP